LDKKEEEGDQWGLLPGVNPEDLTILQDYKEFSKSARGERILAHLRMILHADETQTHEEELSHRGTFTPIDTTAYFIRCGMRRAWALVQSHVNGLDELERMRRENESTSR
jgi:hypothetical protein